MTRVSLVFPNAHRRGGVERVVWDLLSLLRHRHDVSFIGRSIDAGLEEVEFRSVGRAKLPSKAIGFRRASQLSLRQMKPDVAISFGADCAPGDVYWVQSIHRFFLAQPQHLRVRGLRLAGGVRYLMPRHLELLLLERDYFTRHSPNAIVCLSPGEAEYLQRLYRVDERVITVLPNPFDAERFSVQRRDALRVPVRRELGMQPEEVSLLFAANELHRKGFSTLLDAVANLDDRRLRIDVVGRVTSDDYSARIHRLGLHSRVFFHGASEDITRFYAAADVLVLPTEYEPFGLVIIEALATGLPVITTRIAGAARYVTSEVGRLQSHLGDASELASLLREAMDEGRRRSWSAAAPAAAMPCRWAAVLPAVEAIIQDAAEAKQPDARG